MKSLSELHRDISTPLNILEANRFNDLRGAISELENALENRDQQLQPEDIAQARLRLAATALRLSQQTIPMLNELADELLGLAGGAAIRAACSPIQRTDAPPLPSDFKLPVEFAGGIGGKVKSAIQGLAGK